MLKFLSYLITILAHFLYAFYTLLVYFFGHWVFPHFSHHFFTVSKPNRDYATGLVTGSTSILFYIEGKFMRQTCQPESAQQISVNRGSDSRFRAMCLYPKRHFCHLSRIYTYPNQGINKYT